MSPPCVPLFGLWPWVSGSLLMGAKVKCLRMPCQQCIQAISWGTSCPHMSASILVGICVFLTASHTVRSAWCDTGSVPLLQKKLQTGGQSLRIKTCLTHPSLFLIPHMVAARYGLSLHSVLLLSEKSWLMPRQRTASMKDFWVISRYFMTWRFIYRLMMFRRE